MGNWLPALHHLFHAPGSGLAVDLFRICIGTVLFLDSLHLWKYGPWILGERGMFPRTSMAAVGVRIRMSILYSLDHSDALIRLFCFIYSLGCLGLIFGLFTPVMIVIVLGSLISMKARNAFALHSGISFAKLAIFLMAFSSAGSLLSLDAVKSVSTDHVSQWALQLMRLQFCIVYWQSVAHKMGHKNWRDGSMMYYVVSDSGAVQPFGSWASMVLQVRWISSFITWAVILTQIMAPILLWFDSTVYFGIGALVALHLGMWVMLSVGSFQAIMLCGLVLFLADGDIEKILMLIRSII